MRYFLNGFFCRQAKDYGFTEDQTKFVFEEIQKGRAVSLGHYLYKIRAPGKTTGKSAGFRVLFFWKREQFVIFCYLFSKNVAENVSYKEVHGLKILSENYAHLTSTELQQRINNNDLKEIIYD